MLKNPKVTIAIPTFNRKEFLKNAIHSALEVDYLDKEIIISDNGSTDGTALYLDQLSSDSIKIYKSEENKGVIWNWNNCLNHASGDAIIFLSDDDILMKNSISNLIDGIHRMNEKECNNIKFIFGSIEKISDKKEHIGNISWTDKKLMNALDFRINVLRKGFSPLPSSILFSVQDALHAGGFKDKYKAAPDIGLMFEILKKDGIVMNVNKIIAQYTKNDISHTSSIHPEDNFLTFKNLVDNAFSNFNGKEIELKKLKNISNISLIKSRIYTSIIFFQNNKLNLLESLFSVCKGFKYVNSLQSLFLLLKGITVLILIKLKLYHKN